MFPLFSTAENSFRHVFQSLSLSSFFIICAFICLYLSLCHFLDKFLSATFEKLLFLSLAMFYLTLLSYKVVLAMYADLNKLKLIIIK